ncbi:hypothetical protein JYU34_020102 [Plutella xylostella]|uniref:Uncharacterized protein n=1 Tax=Plutella xylostella TaxID=51655 RepID=A0ABQ7PXF1_PLUXY|nr:hypothetical protein JYU34_020102 [Plutella xylostella]
MMNSTGPIDCLEEHLKVEEWLGHHQSTSQMLYGAGLGPGRSGSSSSSPVGSNNLLVVPQPLGKAPGKLQQLHHARKYHCKMCPQVCGIGLFLF